MFPRPHPSDAFIVSGLTKSEAEECLDYLSNIGYVEFEAVIEAGRWTVSARRKSLQATEAGACGSPQQVRDRLPSKSR
jgi:hypothetical protein